MNKHDKTPNLISQLKLYSVYNSVAIEWSNVLAIFTISSYHSLHYCDATSLLELKWVLVLGKHSLARDRFRPVFFPNILNIYGVLLETAPSSL